MKLVSKDLTSGTTIAFKFTVATALNYLCLRFFQYFDGWLSLQNDVPYINVYAGVAFLTVMLLGAVGAAASGMAVALQFAQLNQVSNWLHFCAVVLLSTGLQYLVIYIFLYRRGVSSTLRGLTLRHLLTLGCMFSATYTISVALIQADFQKIVPTAMQALPNNFLGVFFVLLLVRLAIAFSKSLIVSRPRR